MPLVQLRNAIGFVFGAIGFLAILLFVLIVAGRLIVWQVYDIPLSALFGVLA